jgi:hypothetical protein
MSRTRRIYNRPDYFRRFQEKTWYAWIWIPQYEPYKQFSWAQYHRRDAGVTRRWLTKRRRQWYRKQMLDELLNTYT